MKKEIFAIVVLLSIMIGSALWVQNDTEKEAHERFKLNAATAYAEVNKRK